MKPRTKVLLGIVAIMVVVAVGGAAFFVLLAGPLPGTLPVLAGTSFTANETEHWAAHFTVGASGGHVVGAWTAYNGYGVIGLIIVNGSVSKPWPPPPVMCPRFPSWTEFNGSVDTVVTAGDHTAYWSTGYCSWAAQITVTQTLRLVAS